MMRESNKTMIKNSLFLRFFRSLCNCDNKAIYASQEILHILLNEDVTSDKSMIFFSIKM